MKQAMVVTTYPGASAHEVELEVTDKIEKSIREMRSIYTIESQSMNDLSIISVELNKTLPDAEVEQEWDMPQSGECLPFPPLRCQQSDSEG